ncbi:hypothetical protein YH65_04140 [Sulfurovum lithotrophicum]|uniref:ATP-binding protein n=1 Tax=Sulfurovum lithotrophicum TaxID=206403 RepID=A0A7U4M0M4_9BACT|nr:ATP-binding protein [Sulfurovum lithotrophicum]AKF24664.1 hypothetical protein YH65_04140 [Sulfurovum lithotrophicum]
MIRRMILINSANFDLVDIDLSKDVFFLGDNASGKTTTTRAIHYLYNAEGRQLGIPSDKDSFEKYYFPYDNSYIVYVFDDFFMMAFKRSGKVQKWFSKQPFDLERVISNGILVEHDLIRAYLKDVSSYRPQTNAEYRKIIYGQERRYTDFSIASIKNYDAFLEVYNMVFNVDKAIVDMKSIKKAIQKSLQKDDEILSLDFDTYIADMTAFKRDYDFFKKFDRQRDNIKKSVDVMEELVALEETIQLLLGKIRYNQESDKEKLPELKVAYDTEEEALKAFKRRVKHWERRLGVLENKVRDQITDFIIKIKELEVLEEKYSPIQYEEAVNIAAKKNGLKKESEELTISIGKLEEEQSSIVKEIESRIEQLTRKTNVDILAEGRETFRKRKELEENQCDNDIAIIEAEFVEIFSEIEKKIEELQSALSVEEENVETLKKSYESQSDSLSQEYEAEQERSSKEQEKIANQIAEKESVLDRSSRQVVQEERTIEEYKNDYLQARFERAEKLNSVRLYNNTRIKEYQTLLSHEPNTLKAFLAEEVDGWEEHIYPVIDKELLSKSRDVLKPVADFKSTSTLFGVTMDLTSLKVYPTAEELHEKIVQHKEDRKISLVKAREEDRVLKAEYDHFLNQANLTIDNIKSEIKLEQENLGVLQVKLSELKQEHIQRKQRYQDNKEKLKEQFEMQKKKHVERINRIKQEKKTQKDEEKIQNNHKKRQIEQRKKDLEFNVKALRSQVQSEIESARAEVRKEIEKLESEKKTKTEDELLSEYKNQRAAKEDELKECYRAEAFLDEYDEKQKEIATLPIIKKEHKRTETFLSNIKGKINHKIEVSKKQSKSLEEEHQKNSVRLKKLKDGIGKSDALEVDLSTIEKIEEPGELDKLVDAYELQNRGYQNLRIDFKSLLSRLASLEYNAIIDINLSIEKFDEVASIASLEHIKDSLEELHKFSMISYDNQKRSRHADFTNYLSNIIPQKLGTFNDLEDRFEQQKNRINRNLNKVDFGAIKQISLEMDKSKGNNNSIASLMQSLNSKVVSARTMFEDKTSLFFDKPKSIENIDAIIETLGKIKKQSEGGAIHIFDTIDLTISYVENGVKKKGLSHLKNDSSSGGNILLKVAITISILALFANKADKDTPFFLIVDEISRLKHQNQENLKKFINDHGFRTLFITPDPVYPDPEAAMYYMFRNSGNEKGGLEIAQMNIV